MKKRITHIGMGVATLSALVAQGKNFSREKLNTMLDELAASPTPNYEHQWMMAACYVRILPQPVVFEYVCKKCGTHTIYQKDTKYISNLLKRRRDEVALLKGLGLDITLDESVLCQKCRSAKELGLPTSGTVIGKPRRNNKNFVWNIGDKVRIINVTGVSFRWYNVVRASPDEWPYSGGYHHGREVRAKYIGELSYDEKEFVSPGRVDRLAWVINGKRVLASDVDVIILKAFLTGEKMVKGKFWLDQEVPLKRELGRLRKLLGPEDPDPLCPNEVINEDLEVKVDI